MTSATGEDSHEPMRISAVLPLFFYILYKSLTPNGFFLTYPSLKIIMLFSSTNLP